MGWNEDQVEWIQDGLVSQDSQWVKDGPHVDGPHVEGACGEGSSCVGGNLDDRGAHEGRADIGMGDSGAGKGDKEHGQVGGAYENVGSMEEGEEVGHIAAAAAAAAAVAGGPCVATDTQ